MCFAILLVKYRNGHSSDDKPITCKDEADLALRLKDVQGRPEAIQVDVFIHNPHQSIQMVQEWRARATITKAADQTTSNRPADVLPPSPPTPLEEPTP